MIKWEMAGKTFIFYFDWRVILFQFWAFRAVRRGDFSSHFLSADRPKKPSYMGLGKKQAQ